MNNLCIIPARGGSKRIPRKNIKIFHGKPIIAYSIELALNTQLFSEIMVSTNDFEIASISKEYGAKIPFFRSNENSNDFATTIDVIIEVIEKYNQLGYSFDYVCCIYPTSPLISKPKFIEGYNKITTEKLDCVFPVVEFSYPIWRSLKFTENGHISMVWPDFQNKRSQDLEKTYHDAGQWYWMSLKSVLKNRKIFTNKTSSIILNALEVQDIDNFDDWIIAELKYERIQNFK